ncbi:DUF4350 domain-containing protein [Kitasatospora azatica]|uniref:DUF4350 domain-containing protein n=1 Tax=Kitasatospora azatica TaxID=58347 RepID=UPI000A5DA765|nr:DUF4350 domain-containing protein [Kitasatospora azatica]
MTTSTTPRDIRTADRVDPSPADHRSLTPTARQLWLRTRWFLAGGAFLLLAGLLIAGLGNKAGYAALDPRSPDPDGTKAVSQLLRARGIEVSSTADPAALAATPTRDDTVVVPLPDLLTVDQLRALGAAGHHRLVLISPGDLPLELLTPSVQTYGGDTTPVAVSSAGTAPQCDLPAAQQAGSAEAGGRLYRITAGATGCYPRDGHPTLTSSISTDGAEVVVIGSGRFLTNQRLAHDGNASLALALLGSRPHLTWYLPDYGTAPVAAGQKTLTELIPVGWRAATVQLFLAALLAALWRARRLGPLVSEQLPVVVRAAETTEGRARLYQLAKARGRAAEALRRATRHRLAPPLGVPVTAGEVDGNALLTALTERLADQRPPGELAGLLYGPPPTDDAALLRLADDLDALERQVRQP